MDSSMFNFLTRKQMMAINQNTEALNTLPPIANSPPLVTKQLPKAPVNLFLRGTFGWGLLAIILNVCWQKFLY